MQERPPRRGDPSPTRSADRPQGGGGGVPAKGRPPRGDNDRHGAGGEGRGGGPRRDREREAEADDAALRALRAKLAGVLKRLPEIEQRVVELRMGLVDGNPAKPGQVAERLGLTIPEVKKIEARAFERMREVGPIKGLERFLER